MFSPTSSLSSLPTSDAISKHLKKETIVDPIIYHLNTLLTELSVYLCGDFRLERSTG